MEYHWYDFVGNIGVFLILLAYLLLQIGVLKGGSVNFSFLNLIGATLILVSLYFEFNLSAFLIEFFWLIISIIGIIKSSISKDS
jgi:predicted membrane-bound spermidine synthase